MLPMSVVACEGIRFLALVSEEKRRQQIRLRFAGYVSTVVCFFQASGGLVPSVLYSYDRLVFQFSCLVTRVYLTVNE